MKREEILQDYALTSQAYIAQPPSMEHLKPMLAAAGLDELSQRVLNIMSMANTPAMTKALEQLSVKGNGSIVQFLKNEIGVTQEVIDGLKSALLEPL